MVKVKKPSKPESKQIKKVVTKVKNGKTVSKKPKDGKLKDSLKSVLEEKFNINVEDVENAVAGVIKLHLNNPKIKNQLFDEDKFAVNMKLNCHKIPRGYPKILRVPLKYSLLTPEDDVCLIVSEIKGIGNREHEKHVDHYEKLLAEKNVTNIKKIMTVHELNTEHETFEQKIRLADLYDAFLVCGKVSGKVVHKCGKIFYKKRKVPTSVNLKATKLKEHIDRNLSKSFLHLHLKGDTYNVQLGHSKMTVAQIIDNFTSAMEYLASEFPGGFENIKGLHVCTPRSTSIPVYVSAKNPKDLQDVRVKTTNKYKAKAVQDELTTLPNAKVLVKPSGQIIVTRMRDDEDEGDDKEKDDDNEEGDDKITLKDILDDIKNSKHVKSKNEQDESRKKLKSRKKAKKSLLSDWKEETLDTEDLSIEPMIKKKKQKSSEAENLDVSVEPLTKKKKQKKSSEPENLDVPVEPLIKKKKQKSSKAENLVKKNSKVKGHGKSKNKAKREKA
ncbi:ribosomal L1 domain-containing protein 1 [Diabrotica virgifera virgifera]|uniref:Ribosomal L1 domain-containing protein 1-like n=1 Tax=Diabrotica virgifera virgifera TaxID=50390 RepID=A0A6P7F6W5_DIAVI|nr:ribosomal L1 domain-containing protein 1 [Diabrotica virgifera virgifera]